MVTVADVNLAANFFRTFFYGGRGVQDTGHKFLIFGRAESYDLAEVRKEVREFCWIEAEGASDDGMTWAMAVDGLFMHDFRGDEYAEWVEAAAAIENQLREVLERCHRFARENVVPLSDEEYDALVKEIDEMMADAS